MHWQSTSSFPLTTIRQKSQPTKKIAHTQTEGKHYPTPSNACSIPWSSMKRSAGGDVDFPFLASFPPSWVINHIVQKPENGSTGHQFSTVHKKISPTAPVGLTLSISTARGFPQQILHRKLWTTQHWQLSLGLIMLPPEHRGCHWGRAVECPRLTYTMLQWSCSNFLHTTTPVK